MRIKNIAWNLAGLGGPLIVAALTIPALIRMIGMERFGLLALAWGLIGFAGIFDLGIGRATTQTIARLRGGHQLAQVPAVLKTAASLSFRTGLAGAVLLAIAVLAGAHSHIKYAPELQNEVTIAAYLLALAIPIQSMSAMYRGVNEAFENFREISFVRIGLGIANFLGPFLVALFTSNLVALVATLLLSRIIGFFSFRHFGLACASREITTTNSSGRPLASNAIARELLTFGGWITISSVVYPFMMQADRFLIGSILSTRSVSEYVLPYEIIVQSLVIAGAITTTFFPSLTSLLISNPNQAISYFNKWLFYAVSLMLAVSILLATLLPLILNSWLNETLPESSLFTGQILCIGLVPYTIGTMFLSLLHANNRADITAKAHLIETPIYLILLSFFIQKFGIQGAAMAWVLRVSVDAGILVTWNFFRNDTQKQKK